VEAVLTGWLATQGTDFRQQGTENLVPRYDKWSIVRATAIKISKTAVQLHTHCPY
jgi:hypothetical protein